MANEERKIKALDRRAVISFKKLKNSQIVKVKHLLKFKINVACYLLLRKDLVRKLKRLNY
jgi:hypothetical protein